MERYSEQIRVGRKAEPAQMKEKLQKEDNSQQVCFISSRWHDF